MPPLALTRRRAVLCLLASAAATGLAAACRAPSAPATPTPANPLIKPRAAAGADLTAVQASSELALGRNRFTLGLIDAQNQAVNSGAVKVEFFKVAANGTSAEKRSEAEAVFRTVGGLSKGVWVAPASFDAVGPWGAQVTLTDAASGAARLARMNFQVREKFSAPGYGDPAPRSASVTSADVNGDLSHICTHVPPCSLHQLSIADALQPADKPLVVCFATPGFCTSATCAPQLDAVVQLSQSYGQQANFVHVDIYRYPFEQQQTAQAVQEWNLPSEPWTFVVDREGVVRDRFEGVAPVEEVEPSLKALLAG